MVLTIHSRRHDGTALLQYNNNNNFNGAMVAIPIDQTVSPTMTANHSLFFKISVVLSYILIIFLLVFSFTLSNVKTFMIIYSIVLLIVFTISLLFRIPVAIQLQPTCLVVKTRMTSWSLSYERVNSVTLLPSVCCWFGALCSFPKGGFTSLSDGVFFHSNDCGQSICFSPTDIMAFRTMLNQTSLGARVRSE